MLGRSEIKYLEFAEQHSDNPISEVSKVSSRVSRKSHKSKLSYISGADDERVLLQKEEATLKAKLAYIEKEHKLAALEHKKTELTKLEQERKLGELKVESKLAQNQARLNECLSTERGNVLEGNDLNSVPAADKDKDMGKFLDSIPVTSTGDLSPGRQEPVYSSTQIIGAQPSSGSPLVNHGVCCSLSPMPHPSNHILLFKKDVWISCLKLVVSWWQPLWNRI